MTEHALPQDVVDQIVECLDYLFDFEWPTAGDVYRWRESADERGHEAGVIDSITCEPKQWRELRAYLGRPE